MLNCDPVTGACLLPEMKTEPAPSVVKTKPVTLHYVGDPMCSWCWGLSPAIKAVRSYANENDLGFAVTVGGLRAGGGDLWTDPLKSFLRREWARITEVTGQPIGFSLLDLPSFNYDTEPACRAIVSVQMLQESQSVRSGLDLDFFTAVQRKFYVEGQDPTVVDFYASVCAEVGVDFQTFKNVFESPAAKQATQAAFDKSRAWGVRSFPSLLIERDGKTEVLVSGYLGTPAVLERVQQAVAQSSN